MRHRNDIELSGDTGQATTDAPIAPRVVPSQRAGKHRREEVVPRVPAQVTPTHDVVESAPPPVAEPVPLIPHVVRWRASHTPRIFVGVLLLLAVAGTSALGLRYEQDPGTYQLVSLAIGIASVVCLWALLVGSTPQVVSLRGSVITVRNSSGTERFDLGDGLQPIDLVGDPHHSSWALMLHRDNRSSLVLRRRDVDAELLDRVVRHYRVMAARRHADRQERFDR